jgi:serine/threonine protein kinase
VHRDVSIGNILSCDGHAKLANLEFAKKMGDLKSHEVRTASESPITLFGKSLIASEQGTMDFMSIEVAAQKFIFHSEPGPSLMEVDELAGETEQDVGMAWTKVPFSHNHLHDLESLWWIAVWVVFYNYFSEGTSSRDLPSFTLKDVVGQLKLTRVLFPHALKDTDRRDAFQYSELFQEACKQLPGNKMAICVRLNLLRRFLISHYKIIEAGYPLSVDPNSSKDDIYDHFARLFSTLKTLSHDLVLDFIPEIYEKLLLEGEDP